MSSAPVSINLIPDGAFRAIEAVANLLRVLVEKTPEHQHEKNWGRYERIIQRVERLLGIDDDLGELDSEGD
jgi:hypothetical protein